MPSGVYKREVGRPTRTESIISSLQAEKKTLEARLVEVNDALSLLDSYPLAVKTLLKAINGHAKA